MSNPTGKNSPESFDEFTPDKPYGTQQRGNELRKQEPLAGQGKSAHTLNTARRAIEVATKSAEDQIRARHKANGGRPPIPDSQLQNSPSYNDPYTDTWNEIANTPGASDLVKQYASGA